MKYRIVLGTGVTLRKRYFGTYESASVYFMRAMKRLHPYGYIELQAQERGVWMTVENEVGSAF